MPEADFWWVYVSGKNKEFKQRIYQQWCAVLPHLDKEYRSFDKFFDAVTGKNIDTRPIEVITAEIDEAIRSMRNGN